ncbi:MAG: prepilin-type N-terminal cleavage/methylation domain-containing protein [Minisyncoccota bacterium]
MARTYQAETAKGFTLIELLVSAAVFAVLCIGVYDTITAMIRGVAVAREQAAVAALADQYLEIARNLPYANVGTISGNPHGSLPDLPNALNVTVDGVSYQVYYAASYVDDPADGTALAGTDSAPQDYKQVKLYVKNVATGGISNFLTTIVPTGLEGLGSGGALLISVFDAVGQPVPRATITITNTAINPAINITRTADANGNWVEVGLPASNNGYHVVATKNGYSTDATYPSTVPNPNPVKPDATIVNGSVTQVSFSIGLLSTLTFNTLDTTCHPLSSVGLEVRGAKLIGTPGVYKFDRTYTSDTNGTIPLSSIEWDTYTPALTGTTYMVYGSSPVQQISVLPNTTQTFTLNLGAKTANSLMVVVKDASTGNPIEGATVELQKVSPASDVSQITGGSVWSQQDWVGGSGQAAWSNPTAYFQDNGSVNVNGVPSGLRLANLNGTYLSPGTLTSSTFDTGTAATAYTMLTWQPSSQDPATSLAFQIASNNDNTTWNYLGPDGTAGTYYTTPGSAISPANSGNRYVRYKAVLSTTDTSKTPVLSNVTLNYVSGCITPGQVMFAGLQAGSDYSVSVSMAGYQSQTITPVTVNGYNVLEVLLGT